MTPNLLVENHETSRTMNSIFQGWKVSSAEKLVLNARAKEKRTLHNEELNDLYSSPNIVRVIKSRRMRWAGYVARMGEERGVYRVLVGKPEGRRPQGRPRRRWVDKIRIDLQEVGCGYMDWIGLAQGRDRWRTLVSAVMNLRVPWNAGTFLTSCKPVSFSRRTLHPNFRPTYIQRGYLRDVATH